MLTFVRMAWRNLFRNPRRTLLTGAAIGIGLAAFILSLGFGERMGKVMFDEAVGTYLAHAQIHSRAFLKAKSPEDVIPDIDHVLEAAKTTPGVLAVSPRTLFRGLVATSANSSGAEVCGIDVDQELQVTEIGAKIVQGAFLSGKKGEIVIGYKLQKRLKADLGARIVVTTALAGNGELNQGLFRLKGVVRTGSDMDSRFVYISSKEAQSLLGLPGAVHEVALREDVTLGIHAVTDAVRKAVANEHLRVAPWDVVNAPLGQIIGVSRAMWGVMALVVYLVVALGILNTVLMSTLERTREFGVMKSLGTTPAQVGGLILTETTLLGVVSCLAGALIGIGASLYFSYHPIPLPEATVSSFSMGKDMGSELLLSDVVMSVGFVLLVTVLVGLYPAIKAMRIKPVDAMRD